MSPLARWNTIAFPSPAFRFLDERQRPAPRDTEATASAWVPPVDIYEDAEGVTLAFDLPNVDPAVLDIRVENGTLSVKGERKLARDETKQNYRRIERFHGTFNRQFALPVQFDAEKIQATSKHGVLTLFVPRREESKPKSIKVAVN